MEVAVADHQIVRPRVAENRASFYAGLAELITHKALAAQTPNVDAVTGATTTSKCLQKAIANALAPGAHKNFAQ